MKMNSKYIISGMLMEVIEDAGDKWKLLNHTTYETVLFDKALLDKSIKLGKAEVVMDESSDS